DVLRGSRADLSQAFCSYCGYPPVARWRSRAHRVCMRCQTGILLHAPLEARPLCHEVFVIVDERLRLQAVSHHAERVLMIDEPTALNAPLENLLSSNNGDHDQVRLAELVKQAIARPTSSATL